MKHFKGCLFGLLASAVLVGLASAPAYGVDGVVLINQNTATSGLPSCGSAGFPIVICQPGSYKLSSNITVTDPTVTAIRITADNVTLDLNGFLILGPTVCSGSPVTCDHTNPPALGIFALNSAGFIRNITIRNGTVRGFAGTGVSVGNNITVDNSSGNTVEYIHADGNGAGIFISSGIVSNCTATNNAQSGIQLDGGLVRDSVAAGNGFAGILLGFSGNGGMAVDNTAYGNFFGLNCAPKAGYAHNALFDNATNVKGGVNLGGNSCGTSTCP